MLDLSFFNAFSKNASIHNDGTIIHSSSRNPQKTEKLLVKDRNLNDNFKFLCADKNQYSITRAWNLLTGVHYLYTQQDNHYTQQDNHYVGAKGLLDLLVFPLISRALYQSLVDHPDHKDRFYSTFARIIWGALEVARLALAVALLLPTTFIMSMMPEPVELHMEEDEHVQFIVELHTEEDEPVQFISNHY